MNYETKRNVFGQLLNAYQNLMMKGIEIRDGNYRENITTPWNIVYDAALPDNLPVIPEDVSEWLTWCKRSNHSLKDVLDGETRVSEDTFARAWVLGIWRVEETGEIVKVEAD